MIHARHIGLAALVASAFTAACGCPGPPCTLPLSSMQGRVYLENSAATVRFVQPVPFGCDDRVVVSAVTSEVLDDANEVVASSATHTRQDDPSAGSIAVDVTFQTGAPGWYHVRANIEPALAVIQDEVIVARDRTAMTPVVAANECSTAYRTSSGTTLCNGSIVDGGVAGFSPVVLDVRGDVVWAWSTQGLSRWSDGDGGLIAEPAGAALQFSQRPLLLVSSASGDEVYAATSAQVSRVAFRNGSLTKLSEIALGTFFTPRLGFASNGTLFLVGDGTGTTAATAKVKVCGYSLANNVLTKLQQCEEESGVLFGVVDDALWFKAEAGLRAVRADASGKLVTTAALATPSAPFRSFSHTHPPVVAVADGGGYLFPRLVDGRPLYDRYADVVGVTEVDATETAVFFITPSGTRIFGR